VKRRTEVALRDAKLQKMQQELVSLLAAHDEVLTCWWPHVRRLAA